MRSFDAADYFIGLFHYMCTHTKIADINYSTKILL